jgi:hypothetical protein
MAKRKFSRPAVPSQSQDVQVPSDAIMPSEDEIRKRAYERYRERGGGPGRDFDDWIEAERELRKRGGA